ncbi:FkbM family methyltransferase [Pinibacter aurantiacus]|uniref:FkbM family methyltransferase n=1 Tax=Pinibacter aurantiacus TaxID=2851599 RepID=A0A9E2S7S8_9BACT|nr:FkbM family methyltransferase [Pinibacter aurantiacus]MBV4357801.1 FkbM family methyltransferase [Pinibacter aurantiacus]
MSLTFKQKLQNLIFPLGSIQKIRSGYLKGFKIRLSENSLWSPLIGKWEPAMQKIMVNVVKPGDVVYDLGANNGLHGLLMAGLVLPEGKVFNFEPFEGNIEEIVENFSLNNIGNYINVQAAVFDKEGTETFDISNHHKQGAIVREDQKNGATITVPVTSLDAFIEKGNPGPAFIKIDIEGAEGPALFGFSKNIERFNPLMVIELHNPEQDRLVGSFLKQHGYTAYRFDAFANLEFTLVKDLTKGYPAADGIWGSVFCLPPGKNLSDFNFSK